VVWYLLYVDIFAIGGDLSNRMGLRLAFLPRWANRSLHALFALIKRAA